MLQRYVTFQSEEVLAFDVSFSQPTIHPEVRQRIMRSIVGPLKYITCIFPDLRTTSDVFLGGPAHAVLPRGEAIQ